ncbi:MAG: insulinase family protein [Pyrinomonadaceae bacterium]|nr:insulinase family protein [Pyrinomonadaceae bacterium]
MSMTNYFKQLSLLSLILFAAALFTAAQTTKFAAPRQEKLLNNMKLLMWNEPAAEKVSVKLRIHSGAAFDTLDKEGTMAMLADILFPNESVKEFFSEDLGGSLSVESNYDFIQISATGNSDQILTVLETIATAVTKPTIDKETTAKVRAVRLARIKELEKNPAYIADLAVARRLFGSYPYGRSAEGTAESLAKLDFADILLAKQRFLTADNATLAVSGNVKADYVFKAVRQLFGGWEKADKKIPATFAQPNAPVAEMLFVDSAIENAGEFRYAFRSLARNDKDFFAAQILTKILQSRLQTNKPNAFARQDARLLPGYVIIGYRENGIERESNPAKLPMAAMGDVGDLLKSSIETAEFERAKSNLQIDFDRKNVLDSWLDAETYKIASVKADRLNLQNVSLAEVQRNAERWKKEPPAKILVLTKQPTDK